VSLPSSSPFCIPKQTARVARAAFPQPTLAIFIADSLGPIFQDQQFASLFSSLGQPALSPARLALVNLLQFAENLSDRATADAVRSRIDWKYLLGLELSDPGFDFSGLCEFRARLLMGGAQTQLLDLLLVRCREQGWIKAQGRQRTDSTHVVGAIRALNRLELVIETLRCALNALASAAPEWLRQHAQVEWLARYNRRVENFRLPQKMEERAKLAQQVGADGKALLEMIFAPASPAWLRMIEAVETLRRVWIEQYQEGQQGLSWREGNNQLSPSRLITSPYDRQARYASKRETSWRGYKVHLSESYGEDGPQLITEVETDAAGASDVGALERIHEELQRREILPAKHVVDSGYVEAEQLRASRERFGVELIGPSRLDTSWQAKSGEEFAASRFQIDWEKPEAKCPQGEKSASWHEGKDGRGREVIRINFVSQVCGSCASREKCTKSKLKRRQLTIQPRETRGVGAGEDARSESGI
jgi:transposase